MAFVKYSFRQLHRGTPVQSTYLSVQIYLHLMYNLPNPLSAIFSPSIGNLHLGYCLFNTSFYPHRSLPLSESSLFPHLLLLLLFCPENRSGIGAFVTWYTSHELPITRTLPFNNKQLSAKVNTPMVLFTIYINSLRGRLLVVVNRDILPWRAYILESWTRKPETKRVIQSYIDCPVCDFLEQLVAILSSLDTYSV